MTKATEFVVMAPNTLVVSLCGGSSTLPVQADVGVQRGDTIDLVAHRWDKATIAVHVGKNDMTRAARFSVEHVHAGQGCADGWVMLSLEEVS